MQEVQRIETKVLLPPGLTAIKVSSMGRIRNDSRGWWWKGHVLRCVAGVALVLVALPSDAVATATGERARASHSRHVNHSAWFVGRSSSGARIDFRLSPSGHYVRDFHFGGASAACVPDGPWDTSPFVLGLVDGPFPLLGLRVSGGSFSGVVHALDDTPNTPDQDIVRVAGQFGGRGQRRVEGTLAAASRSCGSTQELTFTATRVRRLPARPAAGRRYTATLRGGRMGFAVSRSRRRVTAFRFSAAPTWCKDTGQGFPLILRHSFRVAGIAANRDGVFTGALSSAVTRRGRPSGTRVHVSVLFLSRGLATGTVRLADRRCRHETLTWRATLRR
jgi:hypothetical protein